MSGPEREETREVVPEGPLVVVEELVVAARGSFGHCLRFGDLRDRPERRLERRLEPTRPGFFVLRRGRGSTPGLRCGRQRPHLELHLRASIGYLLSDRHRHDMTAVRKVRKFVECPARCAVRLSVRGILRLESIRTGYALSRLVRSSPACTRWTGYRATFEWSGATTTVGSSFPRERQRRR